MREQYGILFPRFWEGTTGRALQAQGRDAVILAAYLASCRHANMIGLFELPIVLAERELPVLKNRAVILKAFDALQRVTYADYDQETQHVWVREMARIRLGLGVGEVISAKDRKHAAVVKIYNSLPSNPFLGPFFARYHETLALPAPRQHRTPDMAPSKGHGEIVKPLPRGMDSPLNAPPMPVQVQVPVQDQIQGSESASGSGKAAAAPRRAQTGPDQPDDNVSVIAAVVLKEVFPVVGTTNLGDITETTKVFCAQRRIAYDSGAVAKAIDSALFLAKRTPAAVAS